MDGIMILNLSANTDTVVESDTVIVTAVFLR